MASYSTARWSAFQFKVDELMQKPEFKKNPSPALMKFKENSSFLIPASEKERVLGVKQTDQDTVEINLINKQSISTTAARAATHTGSINDSTKETLSFTTYAADFTYSKKSANRTIWEEAEMVSAQIISASIALHSSIETALMTKLNTEKNQSVVSLTPRSAVWDATNFIMQIALSDYDLWMQRTKGFMRENYYRDNMIETIVDETLFQKGEYLIQQGQGNGTNLSWQSAGVNASVTNDLTLDDGYKGMGYAFPLGSIGLMDWIPPLNRQGYGERSSNDGLYTSIPDPLGSGLVFAVHEYSERADNESAAGETQDVNFNIEISVDIAAVIAPMSAANASPVYKFGVLDAEVVA